MDIWSKRYL